MIKRLSLAALVVLLTLALGAGVAVTQQSQAQATVQITNTCDRNTLSISQLVLLGQTTKSTKIYLPSVAISPGQSLSAQLPITEVPTTLQVAGAVDQNSFVITVPLTLGVPITDKDHCLQALVTVSGLGTGQPPQGGKNGLTPGESADQLLLALQAAGISVHQQGSQSKPKLGDAHDPMLLNALAPLSAQLIWVSSSTGNLSSVISWDQSAVDLDLIVIGIGGTFCFSINPPGILAELCDRAPFGPVSSPLGVFAVFIINWSISPQAFVLSLAG